MPLTPCAPDVPPAPPPAPTSAGGEPTGWTYSLWNAARTVALIEGRTLRFAGGDGSLTSPFTADITLPGVPDGIYILTVAVTTATGGATSDPSRPVTLGVPGTPTVASVASGLDTVTLLVTMPQAVAVPTGGLVTRAGSTSASQPSMFTVTLRSAGLGWRQFCL